MGRTSQIDRTDCFKMLQCFCTELDLWKIAWIHYGSNVHNPIKCHSWPAVFLLFSLGLSTCSCTEKKVFKFVTVWKFLFWSWLPVGHNYVLITFELPWYGLRGWLGVKNQLSMYLSTCWTKHILRGLRDDMEVNKRQWNIATVSFKRKLLRLQEVGVKPIHALLIWVHGCFFDVNRNWTQRVTYDAGNDLFTNWLNVLHLPRIWRHKSNVKASWDIVWERSTLPEEYTTPPPPP